MENTLIYTIITGIIATLVYELGKNFLVSLYDKRYEIDSDVSISGIWCSYHERISKKDNKLYYAYELIDIKKRKGKIYVEYFQLNSKNEERKYKGLGYKRGDKVVITYKELWKKRSTHVGAMVLRTKSVNDHEIVLMGNYHEFNDNEFRSNSHPYEMKEYSIAMVNKLKMIIFRNKYVFKLLHEEGFQNECKKSM